MPLVSITRLRVRSWRFLPMFFFYALRSSRQAKHAEGNLAVALLREARNTFWTRTLWESEQAMKQFMLAAAHRSAMPHLMTWCDEASVVHWTQETAELPSWDVAHERMQKEGRRSKVHHPSEDQNEFRIPKPRVTTGELRFK